MLDCDWSSDVCSSDLGTWASHPLIAQLNGRTVGVPLYAARPFGAPNDFILWMSGEMKLDAGAQKVAVLVSAGAAGFVDLLDAKGVELVHCPSTQADCEVNAPAAGWYTVRAAWRKPGATATNFLLRWAPSGTLNNVPTDRLRAPLTSAQLTGSYLEGFAIPRGLRPFDGAVALDIDKPIDLTWNNNTFNLGASSSYRSATQLRITEQANYDLVLDASAGTSYRLWLDGEWLTAKAAFDYTADNIDPAPETISKTLSPGWHDLVLDGYDTRGTTGSVAFTIGMAGQARATPALAATRPAIGAAPRVSHAENTQSIQMIANVGVQRSLTVAPLAVSSPRALAVDVSVTMRPVVWTGVLIKVYPPGAASGIPLLFDDSTRVNNNIGEVDGSLNKLALGDVPAQGEWKVEVIHPNVGGINGGNTVSDVQLHVHYGIGPGVSATPLVPTSSTYSRVFVLDEASELRALLAETIKPAGTDIALSAQLCADAQGTSCQAALSAQQLADTKPTAQFVKVIVTFTSDGFAVPIVSRLVLRYAR
jgi:hypothetical protein